MMVYKDKTFCSRGKTCKYDCERKLSKQDLKNIKEQSFLIAYDIFKTCELNPLKEEKCKIDIPETSIASYTLTYDPSEYLNAGYNSFEQYVKEELNNNPWEYGRIEIELDDNEFIGSDLDNITFHNCNGKANE